MTFKLVEEQIMAEMTLNAKPRDILGKKVRFLRRKGLVPVTMYGPQMASVSLQVDAHALIKVLAEGGRHALVSLRIEGDPRPHMAMVKEIQKNPVTDLLLHADLYKVSMTQPIRTQVPIVLEGESEAVSTHKGTLIQNINHLEVECLPGDIPREIVVDISSIKGFDDEVRVRDLPPLQGVIVHTDPDEVIAMVQAPRAEVEGAPEATAEERQEEKNDS